MRKILLMVCSLMFLGGGIVWARTWIETHLTGVAVTLDRDTPGALLQITVRASTQTAGGEIVREVDRARLPLAQLAPGVRVACRTCYDAVFDAYSLSEDIPTPEPTVTP